MDDGETTALVRRTEVIAASKASDDDRYGKPVLASDPRLLRYSQCSEAHANLL